MRNWETFFAEIIEFFLIMKQNILLYFFDSITSIDFDLLLVQLKDKILYQKQNNEYGNIQIIS